MRETAADLKKRVEYLDSANTLLQIAVHDLITGVRPDASDRVPVTDCGTVYHGQLFRAVSPSGGIVLLTREWDGQGDDKGRLSATSVHYLEQMNNPRWPVEIRILAERLTIYRNRLLALESAELASK